MRSRVTAFQALEKLWATLTWARAGAATLTVTNLADKGPGTLRQHIADASPGDTIDFAVTGATLA